MSPADKPCQYARRAEKPAHPRWEHCTLRKRRQAVFAPQAPGCDKQPQSQVFASASQTSAHVPVSVDLLCGLGAGPRCEVNACACLCTRRPAGPPLIDNQMTQVSATHSRLMAVFGCDSVCALYWDPSPSSPAPPTQKSQCCPGLRL